MEERKNWAESQNTCKDKEGDLVSMETEEEWQFMNGEIQKRNIGDPKEWYIGLKKEQSDWKWVNGKPLTINKWQKIEPDNWQPSGDGDVAIMAKDFPKNTQGLFNDLPETFKRPFICEIPKGKAKKLAFLDCLSFGSQ